MKLVLRILVLIACIAVKPTVQAQSLGGLLTGNVNAGDSGSQHPLCADLPVNDHYVMTLGYLSNYNPDKLSVCSVNGFKHMADLESNCIRQGDLITSYDYIISINGIPADNFDDADAAMKAASTPGENGRVVVEYHSMFADKAFFISYAPCDLRTIGLDESDYYRDGTISINKARMSYATGTDGIIILNNPQISDWSRYRRISFVARSSNPLLEQKYAQLAFKNLEKSGFPFIVDDENPDIILTIAFDEDMQVTSTYVPPTTQYLDNGSNTYIQRRNSGWYVNSFKKPHTAVTTGGFTHKDVLTTHFLEVCLLDAKLMQDEKQIVPPIIWQLTYKKQFERPLSLQTASYKVLAGCRAFPGVHPFHDPVTVWNGICWDTEKPIVRYVYANSPAERLGLLPGDEILKIDGKNTIKCINNVCCDGKVQWKSDICTMSFKNKSFYDMLKSADLDPMSSFNDYGVPFVNVYYQDKYIDSSFLTMEPADIFSPNKTHIIEIKRNGKKMKLEGSIYDRIYLFDATMNLPRN